MKFGIFVHPRRPKVPADKIIRRVKSAGVLYSQGEADIAIVVGGDGTFGYYGRILTIPLLFVGVRELGIAGSRARLAETFYEDLIGALYAIRDGNYCLLEKKMLSVRFRGNSVDVLTDVYLERGNFAGCLRYATKVRPFGRNTFSRFSDYAIGNGVIISTSFGAGGYFSYPERVWAEERIKIEDPAIFADDRIGICHIIPTYLVRKRRDTYRQSDKIRYTVPLRSAVQVNLMRDANARVYGTTTHSMGIPVKLGDTITVTPSDRTAKIIRLHN